MILLRAACTGSHMAHIPVLTVSKSTMSANLFPPLHGPPPPPYTGAYATKSLAFGNDTSMTYRSPLAGGQVRVDYRDSGTWF